jgi:acyl-coenzyme A thioesterase PaaI-like protein
MELQDIAQKAEQSGFYRGILNWLLGRIIPFNKPHGIRIVSMNQKNVRVLLPYRRSNQNHLKGMHACALATAAEFCSGIALLNAIGNKDYRIIMRNLQMQYLHQGKTNCFAEFQVNREDLLNRMQEAGNTLEENCTVEVKDQQGRVVCIANIHWQIKAWSSVKSRN